MKFYMSDAALFLTRTRDKLPELCFTCVDDTLHAGALNYYYLTKSAEFNSRCNPRK